MMDSTPVWVALIGFAGIFVATIIAPIVVGYFSARREKRVADRLLASNARAEKAAQALHEKLDDVHTLVNSEKTALMEREYSLLQEIVALKKVSKFAPLPSTIKHIETLRAELEHRHSLEEKMK